MIELEQCDGFLTNLTRFFNRKDLTQEQAAEYFRAIKPYPIQALREAYKTIVRNQRPVSGNFPSINDVLDLLDRWKHDHPEKFLNSREPCRDCGGNGFLVFWQSANDPDFPSRGYSYVSNCSNCQNKFFGKNFSVSATKEEIQEAGFDIIESTNYFDKTANTDKKQSLEDIAREVFDAI